MDYISEEAYNLVRALANPDVSARLGNIDELKTHQWFYGLDWDALYRRKITAPFVPVLSGTQDLRYFGKFADAKVKKNSEQDVRVTASKKYDGYSFVLFDK